MLIDVGPANVKMSTAIRLVKDYAAIYDNDLLRFFADGYVNDYSPLVADLVDDQGNYMGVLYLCCAAQTKFSVFCV